MYNANAGWTSETATVYEYVRQHPGTTGRQITEATGLSREGVGSRLDNLFAQKYLERLLSAQQGGATRYFPAQSSPNAPAPASAKKPRKPAGPKWTGPIVTEEARQTAASASPARESNPSHSSVAPTPPEHNPLELIEELAASLPLFPPAAICVCSCRGDEHQAVWEGETFIGTRCAKHGGHKFAFEAPEPIPSQVYTGESYTLTVIEDISAVGWREEHGEVVEIIPAAAAASMEHKHPWKEPTMHHRPEPTIFLPLGAMQLCKIDESHGPEAGTRGYCAACEQRYGPIAW